VIPERGGCGAPIFSSFFFHWFQVALTGWNGELGEGKHCSGCREWRRDAEAEAEGVSGTKD